MKAKDQLLNSDVTNPIGMLAMENPPRNTQHVITLSILNHLADNILAYVRFGRTGY